MNKKLPKQKNKQKSVVFIAASFIALIIFILFALFYFNLIPMIQYKLFPDSVADSNKPKQVTINIDENIDSQDIVVLSQNLQIPWEIVFLDDEFALVTERVGNVQLLNTQTGDYSLIHTFSDLQPKGEGGLLGMALHPNFSENNYIYFYLTINTNGIIDNKIERYQLVNNKLTNKELILQGIKGAMYHDGGRIAFGPDGNLYITTGDATVPEYSQDTTNLMGKILRVTDNGDILEDSSFGNEVYSYGHRNPQGIDWDSKGRLWSTEHGPSVTDQGNDELNLILKSGNYGWPTITGTEQFENMFTPILESTDYDTWAPGDVLVYKDAALNNSTQDTDNSDLAKNASDTTTIFFTGLRGEALYKVVYDNESEKVTEFSEYFKNKWGRLRTIELGKDGYFYILTSNTDGRGKVYDGDDKIIKVRADLLVE